MKIYNVEEHLDCYCYSKEDKSLVEVRKFNQTESEEILVLFNKIVFVLKGTLNLTMPNNLDISVGNGHLVFLPAHYKLRYKALSGSVVLVLRINDAILLCNTFNFDRLKKYMRIIDKPETFETLEINARLYQFVNGLVDSYEDGLKCRFYFEAKITEALIMIRAYYAEEQLFLFFYYYFTPDTTFADFIHKNHMNYPTVNKFAHALNMTPQQFSRRFNAVFGEAPYGWMQREKAQLIYGDICRSNRSFKAIADEYGFHIQSNLNRFCKAAFGMTPKEIRKQRK